MPKSIEIPDYKILVPNSVWAKELGTIVWPNSFQAPGIKMLRICKYRAPEEQEVMDLIQRIDIEYNSKKESSERPAEESILSKLMHQFPAREIENIAAGNAESLAHLKKHYASLCSALRIKAKGEHYLQMGHATIPSEALRLAEDRTEKLETKVCESLMKEFGTDCLLIRMMFKAVNILPSNAKINYLLENDVVRSDAFNVSPQKSDYNTVVSAISLLYSTLKSAKKVSQVYDKSERFKTDLAATTMNQTALCISTQESLNWFNGTTNLGPIAILFSGIKIETPKDKQDKDSGPEYLQRFSLN